MSAPAVDSILQKVFLLCAGIPADTVIAPVLAQRVVQDGNWGHVATVVNDYLAGRAGAIGAAALVRQMADQGLGQALTAQQAAAIANSVAAGQTTWADVVANFVMHSTGEQAATLAGRAAVGQTFTDELVASGKGGFYAGWAWGAARTLLDGVTASAGSQAEVLASLHQLVAHLGSAGFGGTATDGHLRGATVFVDADDDGRLDAGEFSTLTDANGGFVIPPGAGTGDLVVLGGTDLLTGKFFHGVMKAPAGATVVTPLTTLIAAMTDLGLAPSAQTGGDLVLGALSLSGDLNLLNYDPIAQFIANIDLERAFAVERSGLEVMNVITQFATAIDAATGLDLLQSANLVIEALARAIASGEPIDLAGSGVLSGILTDAVTHLLGTAPNPAVQGLIGKIALVAAASNQAVAGTTTMFQLAKAGGVTQGQLVTDLIDILANGGDIDAWVAKYTGTSLASLIQAAPVGEFAPGVPVPAPDQARPPEVTDGPHVTESGITFTVQDPDAGGALKYADPFEDLGDVGNGEPTTLVPAAQASLLQGGLAVTDRTFAAALDLYLSLGTSGGDAIGAGDGPNAMWGFGGNDTMSGGGENDSLYGGDGADQMNGGAGDDSITGGAGDDSMTGGGGDDVFRADGGLDVVSDLQTGDALVVAGGASVTVTLAGDFTATGATVNDGAASVDAAGFDLDLSAAAGEGFFFIINSGGASSLTGSVRKDFIQGGSGGETIAGAGGDDFIGGGDGDDSITGGEGDDSLTGGAGNDTFHVDAGTDTVTDLGGSDVFVVGAGATLDAALGAAYVATSASVNNGTANLTTNGYNVDLTAISGGVGFHVTNTGGPATLLGSSGHDTLAGGASNDVLDGGLGNDGLTGGGGADKFNVAAGHDTITDLAVSDVLAVGVGAAASAYVTGPYTATKTSIVNNGGTTLYTAGDAVDLSVFTTKIGGNGFAVNNTAGATTLTGSHLDDKLTGGGGNDTLIGNDGTDTLIGGAGDDQMSGGDGNDTFVVNAGSDTIEDLGDNDIFSVSPGATLNASLAKDFTANALSVNNGTANLFTKGKNIDLSAITMGNGFVVTNVGNGSKLIGSGLGDTLDGGNNKDTLSGGAGDDSLLGGGGNDNLAGGTGNDTFHVDAGKDNVTDLQTGDVLIVDAGATADIELGAGFVATAGTVNDGTASIATNGFNVNLSLAGGKGFTLANAGTAAVLIGSAGDDTVVGGAGNDTLAGAGGDDSLAGDSGDDTFLVDLGSDVITDLGGKDVFVVSAGATLNATLGKAFTANGSSVNNGTASLDSKGQDMDLSAIVAGNGFTLTNTGKAATLVGSGGADTINGGGKADSLSGGAGDDVLTGGGGDDTLTGGAGGDTFNVDEGDDTVTDFANGDKLVVGAGASTALTLGGDFTADAGFVNNGTIAIEANGFNLNLAAAGGAGTYVITNGGVAATIVGSTTADDITGGAGGDIIDGAGGNDTIDGAGGNDTIGGGAGDDTLTGGAGSDTFNVDGGTDTITDLATGDTFTVGAGATLNATLAAKFTATAASTNNGTASLDSKGKSLDLSAIAGGNGFTLTNTGGAATIAGSGGSDTIAGGSSGDALAGGAGNDSITGGGGTDTLTGGTGNDTFNVDSGTDTIADLATGDALVVANKATANAVLGAGFTASAATVNNGTANVDAAGFVLDLGAAGGADGFTVTNTGGATSLAGSGQADTITGGAGNDTLTGGAGGDTLNVDLGTDTVTDLGTGDVLLVGAGATANATVASGGFTATGASKNSGTASITTGGFGVNLSAVTKGNGFTVTNTGTAAALTGSNLADTMSGGAGSDTMSGGAGNDFLFGNGGNDSLTGGADVDTFSIGPGITTVTDLSGNEVFTVSVGGTMMATLAGSYTAIVASVNAGAAFLDAAGNTVNLAASNFGNGFTITNSGGKAALTGSGQADSITGGGGADALNGGAGDDSLAGGGGNDVLTGGTGGDTFKVDAGTDTVTDLGGSDVLVVSAGATATVTVSAAFTATAGSSNAGTANLSSNGFAVDLSAVTSTANGFNVANSGGAAGFSGSAGGDTLTGGTGNDTLGGNDGNDSLAGGGGTDQITGGIGNDSITGGTGADILSGGTGADTFFFSGGDTVIALGGAGNAGTVGGFDTIGDFAPGKGGDAINVTGATAVAASTAGTNGTDSTLTIGGVTVKSHAISNGMISFGDNNTYGSGSAFSLGSMSDVAAAVQYLEANDFGGTGDTVAFTATIGGTQHTFLFTQATNPGKGSANDLLVDLVGVTASGVGTLDAAGYILIV